MLLSPNSYAKSPLSTETRRILQNPRPAIRNIHKTPYRILDAPNILDDFYVNLVDWSSTNLLAVGLANSVYLWSGGTGKVQLLAEMDPSANITSVAWMERGDVLAVACDNGIVQLWDVIRFKKLSSVKMHADRVGKSGGVSYGLLREMGY